MNLRVNRLPIASAITQLLRLSSLLQVYSKSTNFISPFLRRFLSKSIRFMDSLLFSHEDDDDDIFSSSLGHSFSPPSFSDPGESIFLVPFRWWKEALPGLGGAVDGMTEVGVGVLYNARVCINGDEEGFGDSEEISVALRKEDEAGISGEEGDLALVSEWMFFTCLKWHYDKEGMESLLPGEYSAHNLFSLRIRLLYMREESQLFIKISRKENEAGEGFNKAYSVLCSKSSTMQVWDLSGQTNNFLLNDRELSLHSCESNEEMPLELQIYGLSCTINDEESSKEEMRKELPDCDGPSSSSSLGMNGCVDKVKLFPRDEPSFAVGICSLGLTGLYNLGNTCFMNSAVQCLVHTPKLVAYFLGNFRKDLNYENPLGMNGKLAITFGDLLRKLWAPLGATAVAPRMFKSTISSFVPQFSGYNQHDSQEFLSFLLDGLHEDLNRVKSKPYVQAKDEDGRPDDEVADEYWENHISRNDSIIVDLCQGQYRSTLVCPVCKKLSITFDPFMYLSLPLPCSTLRKMTLTILSSDGIMMPHAVTVAVPTNGTFSDLVGALGIAFPLTENETLTIAEIYNNSVIRILVDPDDSLELIRDDDKLVAYRLPKDKDESPLVVFMHQQEEKRFGIPLVARLSDFSKGSDIHKEFIKLIHPFLLSGEELLSDSALEKNVLDATVFDEVTNSNIKTENDCCDFEFYLEDNDSPLYPSKFKIRMDEAVPISSNMTMQPIKVLVYWPEKMIQGYDTVILSLLPEVCKMPKMTRDSISLYNCVDAFVKEEPLGPDDMWYCPNCKEHRQASKKLDLWRLPEILVIHLKRFSFSRFSKYKLESFVDFPINGFDLSNYIIQKNNIVSSNRYMLYAVSNHYGGMGGGHYTAFAKHRLRKWYEFDDSQVFPVTEEQIKTQAAYVLFYKRI